MVVDRPGGNVDHVLTYVSPENVTAPEPNRAILFKAGTLAAGNLYLCTQTEILVYSYPDLKRRRYLSLPCFNDIHHVRPKRNGNLLVTSTGLDMVFEINAEDEIVNEWTTAEGSGWSKFQPGVDYRRISTTKPHSSHPNYVFEASGKTWATRFVQRDALCLDDMQTTIPIGLQAPHDGEVFGDRIYFTTVDGHIVVIDTKTLRKIDVINLNKIEAANNPLGWCRGIHVIDTHKVVVGFSRIRPTRYEKNILWAKHKLGVGRAVAPRPTRIAQYDLKERCLEWEFDVEDNGMNAIFSIHRV